MPEQITLSVVADLANQLPAAEQRQLAESILQSLTSGTEPAPSRRRAWREIRGSVPYPLLGEDAQAWITRCRRESEEQRDQQLRGNR